MLTRLLVGNDNIVAHARAFICAWATRNVGARERVFGKCEDCRLRLMTTIEREVLRKFNLSSFKLFNRSTAEQTHRATHFRFIKREKLFFLLSRFWLFPNCELSPRFPFIHNPKIKHISCFSHDIGSGCGGVSTVSNDTQIYIATDARRQKLPNCKGNFTPLTPNLIHIQGTPAEYKLCHIFCLSFAIMCTDLWMGWLDCGFLGICCASESFCCESWISIDI